MAIKHAISLFRGEAVTLPFDVDEDITGWTLSLLISDQLADSTPTLSVSVTITTPAMGLCQASLTKAQTATLTAEVYHWELARTNAGSEAVLAYGALAVQPRVGV